MLFLPLFITSLYCYIFIISIKLTDTELSQTPSNDDDDDDESKITQVENILSDEQQSNVVNINNDNNPSVQPKLELRKVITINKHEEFSSTSSDDDDDDEDNNDNVVSI